MSFRTFNVLNSRNLAYSGPAKARHNILLVTRDGRLRVLKWAPFVFRIIIIILGSTSGLMLIGSRLPRDTFEFF